MKEIPTEDVEQLPPGSVVLGPNLVAFQHWKEQGWWATNGQRIRTTQAFVNWLGGQTVWLIYADQCSGCSMQLGPDGLCEDCDVKDPFDESPLGYEYL